MSGDSLTRKLTAILYADVAGYSRLTGADEAGTHRQLSAGLDLISERIKAAGGRVVHYAGDAVLAEFASVVAAVETAVGIQRALGEMGAEVPDDKRLAFRIGVNLGEVIVDRDDIYGDGVNVAARLESLAEPGGICISRKVLEEVRDKLEVGYEFLGEQAVKNITEPVPAYHVRLEPQAAGMVTGEGRPDRRRRQWTALAAVVSVLIGAAVVIGWWRPWAPDRESASGTSPTFPQIARPTRHFKVQSSAELADADALTIYDRIRDDMAAVYRQSGNNHAGVYQTWRRYNLTPYVSATHGNRYVNNYANPKAKIYGQFENAGTLPQGSVLAKDSFEVTAHGDVLTGPLALMEKMQPGFNPESRNWRYTMIMPDGRVFGTTKGERSERVEFCAECHLAAGDANDHLFFIPKKHRVRFLEPTEAVE